MLRHHNGMLKDRMRKQKCKCNWEHQNSIYWYHKARNEQQNLEVGMQNSNTNFGGNHPPYETAGLVSFPVYSFSLLPVFLK
jgi:hypothetical protein